MQHAALPSSGGHSDRLDEIFNQLGGSFHFSFGVEIGDDVLECRDGLLNRGDLHQFPAADRTVAILQRDNQIPALLLKLNKR